MFEPEVAQTLVASVALSMALTPLVMVFEERVLRPRFGTREAEAREPDAMDEDAPVILAGVGRFGNFVARLLRHQGIPVTVIDSDSEHIEFLRRIGIKAFYGDVSRHDLLEAAGAGEAKLLIIAVEDEAKVAGLIETARKHFPSLHLMARAASRNHQYELIEDGVDDAVHQHSGSAIRLAELALRRLGFRAHAAARAAAAFERHDRESTRQLAGVHRDDGAYVKQVRERLNEVEKQFAQDRETSWETEHAAWDTDQLRRDTESDEYGDVVPASPPPRGSAGAGA